MGEKKYENIIYKKEDGIAWITLNRPHRLNTFTAEMMLELGKALDEAEQDKEVRCIVITGTGDRAFSAGADVTAFAGLKPATTAVEASMRGQEVITKIEKLSKPVIAAINGYCLGGGLELALACDFRIAAEHAELGSPEIKLGLIPGWGGTQRLVRLVGLAKAKELVMLGDRITAEEALKIGLVNKVVPYDKLEEETKKFAEKLVKGPPIALKYAKLALNFGAQVPLEIGLKLESSVFGLIFSTKDLIEGVTAFMSKKEPEFKGE